MGARGAARSPHEKNLLLAHMAISRSHSFTVDCQIEGLSSLMAASVSHPEFFARSAYCLGPGWGAHKHQASTLEIHPQILS